MNRKSRENELNEWISMRYGHLMTVVAKASIKQTITTVWSYQINRDFITNETKKSCPVPMPLEIDGLNERVFTSAHRMNESRNKLMIYLVYVRNVKWFTEEQKEWKCPLTN